MLLVTAMVDRLSVLGGASVVGASRKRKVSAFASSVCSEHLEDRAMMSAVMESGAVAADVSTAAKTDFTDISGKYTPSIETSIDLGGAELPDLSDAVTTITQKTNKKGITDPSFNSKTVSGSSVFTFNGKIDKNSDTNLTGTFKGNLAIVGVDSTINVKIEGKGVGTIDDAAAPTSIVVEVTLTKDVKVGKGKNAVVVASKGEKFTLTLDAIAPASTAAKSAVGFNVVGKSFDTTLDAVTADPNDGDISIDGVTKVTSQKKNGTVKATTTFKDPNTGAVIGVVKTSGKFVKGTVNTVDGTATILGNSTGKILVNGQILKINAVTVIAVEDLGDTLTATLSGKRLTKLGLSEVALTSSVIASADASAARRFAAPTVAGTFTTEILDQGDNDVSGGGETTLTQTRTKKVKGKGGVDSNVGNLEGTLEVKKGVITGIKKGRISITGENADGNPKTVNAKISKFIVDGAGVITAVAHLGDGLSNIDGRILRVILTPV